MPGAQASLTTSTIQPGSAGSAMSHNACVAPTKQTYQDMLIKLITTTVAPTSWVEAAGSGTIDYMPIGMALVINQTPDVQEQVADLLDALRKLQDLEVAVEVRIITLAENLLRTHRPGPRSEHQDRPHVGPVRAAAGHEPIRSPRPDQQLQPVELPVGHHRDRQSAEPRHTSPAI